MNDTIITAAGCNRLHKEKSPYLLQHALDPVHWQSWGEEAFAAARQEDKPVFLSIGYSPCHWCHVMGRDTFRDPETAEALNRAFISIKVDREERPDIDAVYMAACQALTGSGGWPLSILMTPDQKPFWAGTYLPPRSRDGILGLVELLDEIERLWRLDRSRLLELGQRVTDHIARREERMAEEPAPLLLQKAVEQCRESFDKENGGFGGAPKFPTPHELLFLMAYAAHENNCEALNMAETTLTQISRGGIFDQIGGGFCRYSTDGEWKTPHFEKMLYDNALLAYTYLQAHVQTGLVQNHCRPNVGIRAAGTASSRRRFCLRPGCGQRWRGGPLLSADAKGYLLRAGGRGNRKPFLPLVRYGRQRGANPKPAEKQTI